jgi:putative DNA primase/helicase
VSQPPDFDAMGKHEGYLTPEDLPPESEKQRSQNRERKENLAAGLRPGARERILAALPAPSQPMAVARALAAARYTHATDAPTLFHWRGGWWEWRTTRWIEAERAAIRAAAYEFTEHATYATAEEGKPPRAWAPTRNKITDLLDALAGVAHLSQAVPMPSWLDGTAYNGLLVSCSNGLLDVGARKLLEHTPQFFNATSVPFAYDRAAPAPAEWLAFLNVLWTDDQGCTDHESIRALQEWFGYVISGRLDLHKIGL